MNDERSKSGLLNSLRAGRANLETALAGLTEEHLSRPGVETTWSVKDVMAHLMFWEKRALFYLKAARDGYQQADDLWRADTVDKLNERNYIDQQHRSTSDILDEERSVFQTIVHLVESTPEHDLIAPGCFEWAHGEALYDLIAGESFGHIRDHLDALRGWQAKMLAR